MNLFAREELVYPDSTDPCPYYEVNGTEVDKAVFDEQLNDMIINEMLDRSTWTSLP